MKTKKWTMLILSLAFLVSASRAENYLVNGSFEAGDHTGWTGSGGGFNHQVVSSLGTGITPRTGSYFNATNYAYDTNTLSQTVGGGAKQGILTGYIYLEDLAHWPAFMVSDGTNWVYALIGYTSAYTTPEAIYMMRNGWGDTVPTNLVVTTNTWHKMQYVVDDNGLDFYWNDTPVFQNWPTMTSISQVAIGGGWNTVPTGYDDFSFVDASTPQDCGNAMAMGYGLKEDFDGDCYVDLADFGIFSHDWLRCLDPLDANNLECERPWLMPVPPPPPPSGRIAYRACVAPAMTIDGVLTEWPANDYDPCYPNASQWVAIDQTYYGYPEGVANAFMCLMYDAAANVIYGAVTVDESDPVYGFGGSWNTQDHLELYIQGNPANDEPVSPAPDFANAQQFMIGLNVDASTTYMRWGVHPSYPVIGTFGETVPVGLQAAVKRTVVGSVHKMVYEFKAIPYDNYGGLNSTTTAQSDLYSGAKLSFDVVLSVLSDGYGMLCPNDMTGKSGDVTQYAEVTCD